MLAIFRSFSLNFDPSSLYLSLPCSFSNPNFYLFRIILSYRAYLLLSIPAHSLCLPLRFSQFPCTLPSEAPPFPSVPPLSFAFSFIFSQGSASPFHLNHWQPSTSSTSIPATLRRPSSPHTGSNMAGLSRTLDTLLAALLNYARYLGSKGRAGTRVLPLAAGHPSHGAREINGRHGGWDQRVFPPHFVCSFAVSPAPQDQYALKTEQRCLSERRGRGTRFVNGGGNATEFTDFSLANLCHGIPSADFIPALGFLTLAREKETILFA